MTKPSHLHRSSALGVGALIALAAVALLTTAGRAASSTQTLRFYSKPALFTFTPKGGAPVHHPPAGQAKPGDELEIDSLDYAGSHSHHARQWSASDHLQCVFGAGGQPDCQGQAAVGGSLLLFAGERLVGGTGRY